MSQMTGLPDWLFDANFTFFRRRWRKKNCLFFWLYFLQYLAFFGKQFAHAIRLVSWLFNKDLAEKCCNY